MATSPVSHSLATALAAWRGAVGDDHVIVTGERLDLAGRGTFAADSRILAIVEPAGRDEVVAVLRIAREHGLPVYPISRGRNWGYGSSLPPRDAAVLLSLGRMERIVELDEDLAYVTVEPGVTFGALAEFLAGRGSGLLPPLTGASPGASVVGNALERGIGKGPYESMASHVCALEVVLPSGEIVMLGFDPFASSPGTPLPAEGFGPDPLGLFMQSNLGVVTRMTLRLEPAPALCQRGVFLMRDHESMALAIDALRRPLQRCGRAMQAELMNDYRFLAQTERFPHADLDAASALPRDWIEDRLRAVGAPRWFGAVTLWGDSEEELGFLRRRVAERSDAGSPEIRFEAPVDPLPEPATHQGMRSAYWRKRGRMPDDPHPDRDRCGVIWLAPLLPMRGADVARVARMAEPIMIEHGFEPTISLRMPEGCAVHMLIGILFDREEADADRRSLLCHAALADALRAERLTPYRLGLRDLERFPRDPGTAALLRAIKALLDPEGILAPGRYLPS